MWNRKSDQGHHWAIVSSDEKGTTLVELRQGMVRWSLFIYAESIDAWQETLTFTSAGVPSEEAKDVATRYLIKNDYLERFV